MTRIDGIEAVQGKDGVWRQKPIDPWEDIPDTYDKPKLCRIEDPDCEACQ